LEAALNVALANLESATWGYLAHYMSKPKQGPLPTPEQMRAESISVRRAAAAVDKADKELEEAVDEIMRDNAKKKKRGGMVVGSKYVEQPLDSEPSTRSSTPGGKEPSSRVRKDPTPRNSEPTEGGAKVTTAVGSDIIPADSSIGNTPAVTGT